MGDKYLCVVVKVVGGDAFVLTAYLPTPSIQPCLRVTHEQSIAEVLGDVAAEARDGAGGGLLVLRDEGDACPEPGRRAPAEPSSASSAARREPRPPSAEPHLPQNLA